MDCLVIVKFVEKLDWEMEKKKTNIQKAASTKEYMTVAEERVKIVLSRKVRRLCKRISNYWMRFL